MPSAALADASPPSPISIGPVSSSFYPNSSYGNGAFDVTRDAAPVFTQTFPTIDFNPPADADVQQHCAPPTGIDENSRPFTDVNPNPDGSCTNIVAQGNGLQAGVGSLQAFEAVFTSTLTVAAPGQVTFNLYSDDGWILAAGSDSAGHQPTYLNGACGGATCGGAAPSSSALMSYPVVGAYNQVSAPAQNTVTVNFPAAGAYPIELDYTECCGGQLALVLGTSYANPIQPASGADPFRQIMFVHGINGNSADIQLPGGDYAGLIGPLRTIYTPGHVHIFSYYQDRAYSDPSTNPPACLPGQGESPPD